MKFTRKGFLGFGGAFIAGSAFAATLAGGATDVTAVLRTVNDRLAGEFISHDGLILDYVGDIPTPEEIADLKPNAMGWWCPIENGSMFTGEWLPALMSEGAGRRELVERCVKGLIKMSVVSDVPGFIARGTGTDGKSHHPCGSNDQTDPWFLGLCEYCRWPHADAALKEKALERLVFVAKALEANAWGVPCDGPFKGQNRGNLNNGIIMQFNVFDPEELRDAQRHPEKYQNLQVRVCGWNVRWNDLPKKEQDAYIRRAEEIAR